MRPVNGIGPSEEEYFWGLIDTLNDMKQQEEICGFIEDKEEMFVRLLKWRVSYVQ